MKRTSDSKAKDARGRRGERGGGGKRGADWSLAIPNPHAAYLRDRRWHVRLDPDLVDLLSVNGDPGERLLGVANLPKRRQRMVVTIPMTEREFRAIRPLLDRIGARVEYVPEHPNWRLMDEHSRQRRKAG